MTHHLRGVEGLGIVLERDHAGLLVDARVDLAVLDLQRNSGSVRGHTINGQDNKLNEGKREQRQTADGDAGSQHTADSSQHAEKANGRHTETNHVEQVPERDLSGKARRRRQVRDRQRHVRLRKSSNACVRRDSANESALGKGGRRGQAHTTTAAIRVKRSEAAHITREERRTGTEMRTDLGETLDVAAHERLDRLLHQTPVLVLHT